MLEAGPIGDLTFITGDSGRPLVKESFGTKFRHWCDEAGVTASAHGLRKRAASEAAEAGAADQQLDKMFGWSTPGAHKTKSWLGGRKRNGSGTFYVPTLPPVGKLSNFFKENKAKIRNGAPYGSRTRLYNVKGCRPNR